MADTSRQIQGGVQPYVVGDKTFRGIDTYTDPNKLEAGFAETIDNLIVDGGSLVLRNGFHGQLPSTYIQSPSYSAGIYEMTPVKGQGTQAAHIVFTQGGELYAFHTTDRVQVALSTNFNATYGLYSPNVRLTTFGKYIYGVPGLKSDGSQSTMPMFRVNTAQFMPVTFTNSSGDLLVNLSTPYNTYLVENGSPIRIRLVTGALPSSVSPSVTYYVRDYTSGASTSTFKLSATLTGSRIAYAAATGTYQLVWMAEVLPTITGFPNLSPLARPYFNSQWAIPPTQQKYFIDEAVGPNLITETGGGSTNLIINGTFTAFTSNVDITATPLSTYGWAQSSGNVTCRANGYAPSKSHYLGNATNTINTTATGSNTYKTLQIDGASDQCYTDIPTSGGTPRIPREQVNYVDQRQSGNLFEGVIGGVNTTVTFSGTNVNGTYTGTAVYPYGSAVQFTTTGALPSEIALNTTYYVIGTTGTTAVTISTAYGGSAITFSGAGTGTHTMVAAGITTFAPHALSVGQRIVTGTPPAGTPTSGLSASSVECFVLSVPNNRTFTLSTTSPTGSAYVSTQGGYVSYKTIQTCGQYALSLWAINLDDQNSKTGQSILLQVQGSDIDGNEIAGAFTSQIIAPPIAKSNGDWVKYTLVVDFRVYESTLGSMRITVKNINVQAGDDKGIYITNVECYAISPRLGVQSTDVIDKQSGLLKVKAIQNNTNLKGYAGRLKGCCIKLSLGTQCIASMSNGSNSIGLSTLTGGFQTNQIRPDAQVRLLATGTMPTNFASGTTYFADGISNTSIKVKANAVPSNTSWISCGSAPTGTQYALVRTKFDWSKYDTVSIRMVFPQRFQSNIPQIRLGIQESSYLSTSEDLVQWGGFGQYDIDNGYMTWSIRGFGKTNLDSVTQIYLRFETDIENIQSNDDIVAIGNIGINGNLTAGSKYAYRYTCWYPKDGATAPFTPATGTATASTYYLGFESEPTKLTGELTATDALSTNQIVLNPNAESIVPGGQAYTHFIIYRRSTSFPDGLYRCIGSVPVGMTTALGTNLSVQSTTDGKYVLIDNVPEMDVLDDGPKGSQGDIYESGQDFLPNGATTCVVHQSRLWVGNKNTVWVSWFHNIDNEYTINTTHVPILTDPKVTIKGASFDVSTPYDTEYITGFQPYHGDMMSRNNSTSAVMLVYRENTVYPVTGFDPSNWNIQGFLAEPGIGLLAKRATTTVQGQPWWVNSTGLVQFAGTKVIPVSIQLDGIFSYKPYKVLDTVATNTNTSIALSDYQQSLMTMHDKRLWLFGPSATYGSFTGIAGVRTAFVYDTRLQAWTTVKIPSFGNTVGNITAACSLQSSNDTESLYVGAANGQIYRYREYYDSPYEMTVTSVTVNTQPTDDRCNITSADWTTLYNGQESLIIITSSTNPDVVVNHTYSITLSASGGNYFVLRPAAGGTSIDITSTNGFSFRPAHVIDWVYNSRLYGQTYNEGISYYSKNRPHQLDLHVEADDGGSLIQWCIFGAGGKRDGTNTQIDSNSTMSPKQYTFYGNSARAIRGVPTWLNDINWQIILNGSDAFYPFRIYGAHIHMIESGVTRHR